MRYNPRQLYARVGELVLPKFNRLVDALRSNVLYSGPGILLTPRIGGGVTIAARFWLQGFGHPWKSFLTAMELEIEPGLVNGIEPTIDGQPMSGRDGRARPKLKLDVSLYDSTGRSWIAIELTRDAGRIAKLRIIQTPIYLGQDGGTPEVSPGVALEPIVMFKRPASDRKSLGELRQVRFFNVNGWRVNLAAAGGPRHFFP